MCRVCESDDHYDMVLNDHRSRTTIALDSDHARIEVLNASGGLMADCIALFCPMCGRDLRDVTDGSRPDSAQR